MPREHKTISPYAFWLLAIVLGLGLSGAVGFSAWVLSVRHSYWAVGLVGAGVAFCYLILASVLLASVSQLDAVAAATHVLITAMLGWLAAAAFWAFVLFLVALAASSIVLAPIVALLDGLRLPGRPSSPSRSTSHPE